MAFIVFPGSCGTLNLLFSSFSSQQAIDSKVKAGAVPSVTVKVRCLTQTVAFE